MRWSQSELDAYTARIQAARAPDDSPDPGPESMLQRKIVKWAHDNGYPILSFPRTPKIKSVLPAGWPDVCLILKNKVLFCELKAGKGRLSKDQEHLRLQFMALGHEIFEVRSFKRFLEIVREV